MLKLKNRLKKERDFDRVYKKGLFSQGKYLKVNFIKNNFENPRVGFVISKKIEKSAVKRNRTKRKAREAFKTFLPKINGGFDIVISIKKEALEANKNLLEKDLEDIFSKKQIING